LRPPSANFFQLPRTQVKSGTRDAEESRRGESRGSFARGDAYVSTGSIELAERQDLAFLALLSHELRPPVYGGMGMTELALDEDLAPIVRGYLRSVQNSASSLLTLVNSLRDYSVLEAGGYPIEHAAFDLPRLIAQVVERWQPSALERGVALSVDI